MKDKVFVSQKELRRRISELLSTPGMGWQSTGDLSTSPVNISAVVDPSASATDPGNDNFVPRNRAELRSTVSSMIDEVPDDDADDFYFFIKKYIDGKNESDENVKKESTMKNKSNIDVETLIRRQVRKMLSEVGEPLASAGLASWVGNPQASTGYQDCMTCDGGGFVEGELCPMCRGTGEVKITPGKRNVTVSDVGGMTLPDIATTLGLKSHGKLELEISRSFEKIRKRINELTDAFRDELRIEAINAYIDVLAHPDAELTEEEVKLLKDNPETVGESLVFQQTLDTMYDEIAEEIKNRPTAEGSALQGSKFKEDFKKAVLKAAEVIEKQTAMQAAAKPLKQKKGRQPKTTQESYLRRR